MKKQLEFTKEIQQFLKAKSYSHIMSLGVSDKPVRNSNENSDYILIPLKPHDPRISNNKTDLIIEEIESSEVLEMAEGVTSINFLVEIPGSEYEEFTKANV